MLSLRTVERILCLLIGFYTYHILVSTIPQSWNDAGKLVHANVLTISTKVHQSRGSDSISASHDIFAESILIDFPELAHLSSPTPPPYYLWDVYAVSAHLETRLYLINEPPRITLLLLVKKGFSEKCICLYKTASGAVHQSTVKFQPLFTYFPKEKIKSFFAHCQLHSKLFDEEDWDPPHFVTLALSNQTVADVGEKGWIRLDKSNFSSSNDSTIPPTPFPPLSNLKLRSEYNGRRGGEMAICAPPIFGDSRATGIEGFIKTYKLLGFHHFYFYNISAGPKTTQELFKYRNVITMVQWRLPSAMKLQPDSASLTRPENGSILVGNHENGDEIWSDYEATYFGQMAAVNDCLMRVTGRFRWVGFWDVDEFVLPGRKTIGFSMRGVLNRVRRKLGGVYTFLNVFHHSECEEKGLAISVSPDKSLPLYLRLRPPSNSNLSAILFSPVREIKVYEFQKKSKNLVDPFALLEMGIHLPTRFLPLSSINHTRHIALFDWAERLWQRLHYSSPSSPTFLQYLAQLDAAVSREQIIVSKEIALLNHIRIRPFINGSITMKRCNGRYFVVDYTWINLWWRQLTENNTFAP